MTKQTLLNNAQASKQKAQKNKNKRVDNSNGYSVELAQNIESNQGKVVAKNQRSVKTKAILFTLFILTLLILPYPKLIQYEKLTVVTQSIYVPSFFNLSTPQLLDSNGLVTVEQNLQWMYICNDIDTKQNCQRYQIVKMKGTFSALFHYLTN